MKTNRVRTLLRKGRPAVGTWLTLADTVSAQLMATCGFDWLTVELEHSHLSLEHAARACAIVSAMGCVPLVRVPLNTAENIKRVLDTGAWGLVVPLVNSQADAEAVVRASRYPPLGRRTVGGQLGPVNFATDPGTYFARSNEEILVVVMAETREAITNIDAVFVGPNDLHASLGATPAFDSDLPEFHGALAKVLAAARRHGVAPGIHVPDAAHAARRIAEGWQFVAVSSEAGFMLSRAGEIVRDLGLRQAGGSVKY